MGAKEGGFIYWFSYDFYLEKKYEKIRKTRSLNGQTQSNGLNWNWFFIRLYKKEPVKRLQSIGIAFQSVNKCSLGVENISIFFYLSFKLKFIVFESLF